MQGVMHLASSCIKGYVVASRRCSLESRPLFSRGSSSCARGRSSQVSPFHPDINSSPLQLARHLLKWARPFLSSSLFPCSLAILVQEKVATSLAVVTQAVWTRPDGGMA